MTKTNLFAFAGALSLAAAATPAAAVVTISTNEAEFKATRDITTHSWPEWDQRGGTRVHNRISQDEMGTYTREGVDFTPLAVENYGDLIVYYMLGNQSRQGQPYDAGVNYLGAYAETYYSLVFNGSFRVVSSGPILTLTLASPDIKAGAYPIGYGGREQTISYVANGVAGTLTLSPGRKLDPVFIGFDSGDSSVPMTVTINYRGVVDILGFETGATTAVAAVPEPSTWAVMLLGFGVVGGAARRRRHREARVAFA